MTTRRGERSREYVRYMASPEWQRLRTRLIAARSFQCERCHGYAAHYSELDVHHKTYERLGRELDSDLLVVCRPCHRTEDRKREVLVERKRRQNLEAARYAGFCRTVEERDGDWRSEDQLQEMYDRWIERRGG